MPSSLMTRIGTGRLAAGAAALLAVLALCACSRGERKPAVPPDKVTIAYSASPDAALAQIAQTRGLYRDEGLEAIPQTYPYGKLALQAVLDGKADVATAAETPIMFAVLKGSALGIIATIQTSNRNNAVIARRDRGVLSASDLKGRRIGATFGTISEFYMDSFLITHGIPRKAVKAVNLRPEEMADALVRGEVDAVSAFAPYTHAIRRGLDDRAVVFQSEDIYTQTFNLVATQEYIGSHPAIVRKMLRSLVRAEEFAARHPEEAQQVTAEFCRMDKEEVRAFWRSSTYALTLDQSLLLALEDESRWAIETGLTDRTTIPNYLEHIYVAGLESVRPKAVRILR